MNRKKTKVFILNSQKLSLCILFFISSFILFPKDLNALDASSGRTLFKNYCSGCHINGSNIIRRSKNLKLSSLKRNGIEDQETIAKIAREGIGIMDGYKDQLGENGDQIVANWIWNQAQNAWIQE